MAKRLADIRKDSKDKGKQIFLVESSFRELNSGDPQQASSYERVEQVVTVGNRPPASLFFSRYRRKNDVPAPKSRSKKSVQSIGVGTPSSATTSGIPRRNKYNFSKSNMVSALPAVDINRNERVTPLEGGDKVPVKADIIPNGNVAKVVTFKDAKLHHPESSRASASTDNEISSSPSPSEASRSSRASIVRQSETTPSSRNSVLSLRRERPISGSSHLERTLEFGDANLLMERRRAMYALHVDKDSLLDKILDCECLEWNLNTAAILITVAVLGVAAVLVIYIIVQMVTEKTEH